MNLVKHSLTLACFAALVACGGGGGGGGSDTPTNNDGGGDVVTPVEPTTPDEITKTEDLTLSKTQSVNSHKSVTFNVNVESDYVDGNIVLCASSSNISNVEDINFNSCIYNGIVEATSFSVDVLMINSANVWTAAVLKNGETAIVKNFTGVSAGDTISL